MCAWVARLAAEGIPQPGLALMPGPGPALAGVIAPARFQADNATRQLGLV